MNRKKKKENVKMITPKIIDNIISRFIENADPKFVKELKEIYNVQTKN